MALARRRMLKATGKVIISSLVLPMVMSILNATSEIIHVFRYTYTFGKLPGENIVPNDDLCQEVIAVRRLCTVKIRPDL